MKELCYLFRMSDENGSLKLFIDALAERQQDRLMNAAEYHALFSDFGLTHDEEVRLTELAEHHVHRSRQHSQHNQMTGAVAEMERAAILQPSELDILSELGNLYLERCLGKQLNMADLKKAIATADNILEQYPGHTGAEDILERAREIKKLPIGWKRFRGLILFFVAAIIIILSVLGIYNNRELLFRFISLNEGEIEEKINNGKNPLSLREPRLNFGNEKQVEVSYTGTNSGLVEWNDFKAGWIRRDDAFAFSIQGKISSPTKSIESLTLTLEGKSSENVNLFTRRYPLVNSQGPALPPDHVLYFNESFYLKDSPDKLERIIISLPEMEYAEAELSINPVEIPVHWEAAKPEGIKLRFYLLGLNTRETFDKNLYYISIGLENYSIREINRLETLLEIRDETDKILDTVSIPTWNPEVQPISGMSRTRRIITLTLPDGIAPEKIHYRSVIKRIKY